jgi:hypothetical protein
VVSNFTEWASPLAGILYLAAFAGVAMQVVRGTDPTPRLVDRPPATAPLGA